MVEIIAYKQSWPIEFKEIAGAIRSTLGKSTLRIDHIGSTSVPQLAAKDVIDIQVTVSSLTTDWVEKFTAMGYVYRGDRTDHVPPGALEAPDQW